MSAIHGEECIVKMTQNGGSKKHRNFQIGQAQISEEDENNRKKNTDRQIQRFVIRRNKNKNDDETSICTQID